MNEEEWLGCAQPDPMLETLPGKVSERKLRLFGVACCRRVPAEHLGELARLLVDVAERQADGTISAQERKRIWSQGAPGGHAEVHGSALFAAMTDEDPHPFCGSTGKRIGHFLTCNPSVDRA